MKCVCLKRDQTKFFMSSSNKKYTISKTNCLLILRNHNKICELNAFHVKKKKMFCAGQYSYPTGNVSSELNTLQE